MVIQFPKTALSNVVSLKGSLWVLFCFSSLKLSVSNCYPRMYAALIRIFALITMSGECHSLQSERRFPPQKTCYVNRFWSYHLVLITCTNIQRKPGFTKADLTIIRLNGFCGFLRPGKSCSELALSRFSTPV